jgi:hypothetical protein
LIRVAYYITNTPVRSEAMLEDPVMKRTAIAAAIGAVIAVPVPFVGPFFGAIAGAAYGYISGKRRA